MDISLVAFRGAAGYEVDQLELEARYTLELPTSLTAIVRGLRDPHYTYQIDFLADNDGHRRKSVYFGQDGLQSHRENVSKVQVRKPVYHKTGFGAVKIALSSENSVRDIKLNDTQVKMVRMKLRAQFHYGVWRFDITLVKQLNNWTTDILRGLRQSIMTPVSSLDEFAQRQPHYDHIEYEVEYTGTSIPGIFDAMRWYRILYPHIDTEYWVALSHIATRTRNPNARHYERFERRFDFNGMLPKAHEVTVDKWRSEYHANLYSMIVRDKIDGERRLLQVYGGHAISISNGERLQLGECEGDHLFDCEYYNGRWYILHPLILDGRVLVDSTDLDRMEMLSNHEPIVIHAERDQVVQQCRWALVHADTLQAFYRERTSYNTDGYLFADNRAYWEQRVVKWKPTSTVDFLVHRCPDELVGKHPYVRENDDDILWVLMHGISSKQYQEYNKRLLPGWGKMFHDRQQYFPIQFSPHDNEHAHIWSFNPRAHGLRESDIHGAIVEFRRDVTARRWHMMRIRQDRTSVLHGGSYMGNSFQVVTDIWQTMHDPFLLEYIERPPTVPDNNLGEQLADWITGEGTLTAYNCSIPWDSRSLLQVVEPQYTWLARDERVQSVRWDEPAPRNFIGGTDMIAVVGDVKSTRWNKWLKHGGTAILMHPGDQPPCDGATRLATLTDHTVWSWQKQIGGAVGMTQDQIHAENPHLRTCANAAFRYKFSRSKNREITAADKIVADDTSSMRVDSAWGIRLCLIETLSQMPSGSHVWYNGNLKLANLFPELHFIDHGGATRQNVHCYLNVQMIDVYEDIATYKPDLFGYLTRWDQLPKNMINHKLVFIPYSNPEDRLVWITGDAKRTLQQYVQLDVLKREMDFFHNVYRPSCFKHTYMVAGLDNCWDCRSEVYVIQRYMRSIHAPKRARGVRSKEHFAMLRTTLQTI